MVTWHTKYGRGSKHLKETTVNFDAHWTSGTPQKGGFEIPLATDSTRFVAKFSPLNMLNEWIWEDRRSWMTGRWPIRTSDWVILKIWPIRTFYVRLVDAKNEENISVFAGRSLLLSSQSSRGRFDPFPPFLRPATQANIHGTLKWMSTRRLPA